MSDSEDENSSKDRQIKVTLVGDGTAGKVNLNYVWYLSFARHLLHRGVL